MIPSAIPLITFDSNTSKFILNSETLKLLQTIESPLAIVSVAGMYRTGKSYLINRVFLNKSKAFAVGPSINPCTKGI
jgi:Guanylate-binding protein, N-terminal domain.